MGFLDKMKSSVSGVSAQQRYASNIRKINAQIQSNEKEIERLTMQVGIQCVNLHLEEPGTEYENLFCCDSPVSVRKQSGRGKNPTFKRAAGGRRIVNGEYHTVHFVEDVSYQVLYGVAKLTKEMEKVSGDNYICRQEEAGRFVMCLSDGMGSGVRHAGKARKW